MYVCMYVSICMYVCMYQYVCMYVCMYQYVCMYVLGQKNASIFGKRYKQVATLKAMLRLTKTKKAPRAVSLKELLSPRQLFVRYVCVYSLFLRSLSLLSVCFVATLLCLLSDLQECNVCVCVYVYVVCVCVCVCVGGETDCMCYEASISLHKTEMER